MWTLTLVTLSFAFHAIIYCQETARCALPKDEGICRARMLRYYFNPLTKTCERFLYKGCGGNENNFVSIEECENTCNEWACTQPMTRGFCRGRFFRHFYNVDTRRCEFFIYGGCLGNTNNFETPDECNKMCGAITPRAGVDNSDSKSDEDQLGIVDNSNQAIVYT